MFKLLRLAIYGIVGYAVYAFVTDIVNSSRTAEESAGSSGGQRRGGGNRGRGQGAAGGQPTRLTGAKRGGGTGKSEETADSDGGTTRHRVGRGVV